MTLYVSSRALDEVNSTTWASFDVRVGMLKGVTTYAWDYSHEFVDDLVPATNEVDVGAVPAYARASVTGCTAAEQPGGSWRYDADTINFGSLAGTGLRARWCFIYAHVTNDADSWLIALWDAGSPGTAFTGASYDVAFPDGVFIREYRAT